MQDPNERRIIQEEIVQTPAGAASTVVESRTHIEPTPAERAVGNMARIQQIIWFIIAILVALIAIRFVLLLLGANVTLGFGSLIYNITQPFVGPFLSLFGEQGSALRTGSVVESGSVVAVIVYGLLGWLLTTIVGLIMAPKTPIR